MLSSLILTNQLTREEALKILESPAHDLNTIDEDFKYIANKLDISIDELNHYFNLPKKFYWDYNNQQAFFKFGASILRKFGIENVKKRSK